ncbi:ras and ef-hand domain-containing protein [Anaeramoeba flamelloides]|uniref:Ras-related protein Rab-1 n=1 Tax=Anaeramoeba flamelloides TaxID=1746091 RepID=A0AAV8A727_9EUKA|nr:ras and ef-hand domain-containing protein [Anaeramoeba flamelloides]
MINEERYFKILIIGDTGVGKSCIMVRFTEETFNETYISTIGVDFKVRTVEVNNKPVKLQIWDTAGQERFKTITRNYYKGSQGILMVYDVTNSKSFENIKNWSSEVDKFSNSEFCKYLVGNKCDLQEKRRITYGMGEKLANELGIKFFESSAKSNKNIDAIFHSIAIDIDKNLQNKKNDKQEFKIKTKNNSQNDKKKCC